MKCLFVIRVDSFLCFSLLELWHNFFHLSTNAFCFFFHFIKYFNRLFFFYNTYDYCSFLLRIFGFLQLYTNKIDNVKQYFLGGKKYEKNL